jgi:hypothetical protein
VRADGYAVTDACTADRHANANADRDAHPDTDPGADTDTHRNPDADGHAGTLPDQPRRY